MALFTRVRGFFLKPNSATPGLRRHSLPKRHRHTNHVITARFVVQLPIKVPRNRRPILTIVDGGSRRKDLGLCFLCHGDWEEYINRC